MPWLDGWFGPKVGTIRDHNEWIGLMRTMAECGSRSYTLDDTTRSLDPETATITQLREAMMDCRECWKIEYPETQEGTYWAMARYDELKSAMHRRFPLECEL